MKTSWSDIDTYKAAVERFVTNDESFNTFRSSDINYHLILEHTQYPEALECIPEIVSSNAARAGLLELGRKNDSVGSPHVHPFEHIGPFSCSTVRYMLIASRIYDILQCLHVPRICEVGGGYGGLAALIIGLTGARYTIHDLPIVERLQAKYLKALGHKLYEPSDKYDCFISTWALNELHKDEAAKYSTAAGTALHGYVVGLWIGEDCLNLTEWTEMAPKHATHKLYVPSTGFDCTETRW